MAQEVRPVLLSPRLSPGDRVRLVSPASPPDRGNVAAGADLFTSWGLAVEYGRHLFDEWGYMAGRDADRLGDLNDALRDPGVRAIFTTTGGKGAYRITAGIDIDAVRLDPKPVIGFSDVTHVLMTLWARCGLAGVHGPFANWSDTWTGPASAEALRRTLFTTDSITLTRTEGETTAAVNVPGRAEGVLVGGNLDALRTMAGPDLPSLAGTILFLEHRRGTGLGEVDRALTQLIRSRSLDGLRGVVLGQFTDFDKDIDDPQLRGWTITDVLTDRLTLLGVPVLGGIPAGHGLHPPSIPIGTPAVIDVEAGTLTVQAAVF